MLAKAETLIKWAALVTALSCMLVFLYRWAHASYSINLCSTLSILRRPSWQPAVRELSIEFHEHLSCCVGSRPLGDDIDPGSASGAMRWRR